MEQCSTCGRGFQECEKCGKEHNPFNNCPSPHRMIEWKKNNRSRYNNYMKEYMRKRRALSSIV